MAEALDRVPLRHCLMRETRHVHVIGAGLAGLAAAVSLAGAGRRVTLYEAGPVAGGRCRSYHDRELDCRIDNGNHLLLSGNVAAMAYLAEIGAANTLAGPDRPLFPFVDVASGARWVLAPSRGRIPWWILDPRRRVPDTRMRDYLMLLAFGRADTAATVKDTLGNGGALYRRLLEPLAIAALNTPPEAALASLLRQVVRETLLRGGAACLPRMPRTGLSETFVDPALRWLAARGARLLTGRRVTALGIRDARVVALATAEGTEDVAGDDIVLAVPAPVAADLLPGLVVPRAFSAILNVHFRRDAPRGPAGFTGVIGGTAEWVFVKPGIVSVTVSAANRLIDLPAAELAALVWPDVCAALGLSGAMPPWRVVKERRATFAATAEEEARRPPARTWLANLVLAGDWTATGLPATIEGAIRSGRTAADLLLTH
jgi:squalene-associated FAD-dependent desaturase